MGFRSGENFQSTENFSTSSLIGGFQLEAKTCLRFIRVQVDSVANLVQNDIVGLEAAAEL